MLKPVREFRKLLVNSCEIERKTRIAILLIKSGLINFSRSNTTVGKLSLNAICPTEMSAIHTKSSDIRLLPSVEIELKSAHRTREIQFIVFYYVIAQIVFFVS